MHGEPVGVRSIEKSEQTGLCPASNSQTKRVPKPRPLQRPRPRAQQNSTWPCPCGARPSTASADSRTLRPRLVVSLETVLDARASIQIVSAGHKAAGDFAYRLQDFNVMAEPHYRGASRHLTRRIWDGKSPEPDRGRSHDFGAERTFKDSRNRCRSSLRSRGIR